MLALIGVFLILIWIAGLLIHVASGVIHLALIVGLILVIMHFLSGRTAPR